MLYNLNIDPSEKFNIPEEHPEIIEEMRKVLEVHLAGIEPVENQPEKYHFIQTAQCKCTAIMLFNILTDDHPAGDQQVCLQEAFHGKRLIYHECPRTFKEIILYIMPIKFYIMNLSIRKTPIFFFLLFFTCEKALPQTASIAHLRDVSGNEWCLEIVNNENRVYRLNPVVYSKLFAFDVIYKSKLS